MITEEFIQYLSNLEKKLDKLYNLNVKIAKSLHLLPVTEEEERKLQLTARNNLKVSAKVNEDLNAMENKSNEPLAGLNLDELYTENDVYSDIIGEDFLGG